MKQRGRFPASVLKWGTLLSIVFTLLSPRIIGTMVYTADEAAHLLTGYPVPFLQQETTLTPPAEYLPRRIKAGSPLEWPTSLLFPQFALSILIVWPFGLALVYGYHKVRNK